MSSTDYTSVHEAWQVTRFESCAAGDHISAADLSSSSTRKPTRFCPMLDKSMTQAHGHRCFFPPSNTYNTPTDTTDTSATSCLAVNLVPEWYDSNGGSKYWYCCMSSFTPSANCELTWAGHCHDGPMLIKLQPACLCHHVKCSSCRVE